MQQKTNIMFTSVRKDRRSHELHVQQLSLDRMLALIGRESKERPISLFRRTATVLETLAGDMDFAIQRIFCSSRMKRDGAGGMCFDSYNGLVLLTVGNLTGIDEAQMVKRLAAMHPSTYAAFVGSSGKTAKVLVRVSLPDGTLPTTLAEARRFHTKAYMLAFSAYNGMLNFPIRRVEPQLEQSFVRTFDPSPFVNPDASPLRLDTDIDIRFDDVADEQPIADMMQRIEPGVEGYAQLEQRFMALALRAFGPDMDETDLKSNPEVYLTSLARECCRAGFPLEEAVLHATNDFHSVCSRDAMHALFESAYRLDSRHFGTRNAFNKTQQTAWMLHRYMSERYVLRHNTVQDTEEYRHNTTWDTHFHPLDDRMLGKMVEEARRSGINVWDRDVRRYVHSANVASYNPVEEFLNSVRGTWDGTDRIRQLADTVPNHMGRQWADWFYRWMLSMVAQWMNVMGPYGNSVAPLLIGPQGYRKSTFCRNLLPEELQWGYTDQLDLNSRKEVDRTICQYLLVNLDEFDQLSRRSQDGYLKNLLQRADIRARKPYKTQVSQMRRYASFIGTSNQADLLTDPSGNRRYICVELTAPIDTARPINHRQLYAQALHAVESGEQYWFSDDDVTRLMEHNRQYMHLGPAEMLFHDHFRPALADEAGAAWMTTTQLLDILRRHIGSRTVISVNVFGRYLRNLPGLISKHTSGGSKYLVKCIDEQ